MLKSEQLMPQQQAIKIAGISIPTTEDGVNFVVRLSATVNLMSI
jgi:hypothetical protein